MDCCNYMQYRSHQSYSFGPGYYDTLPDYNHVGEFYGHHVYHDYYNSPYYSPQWPQVAPFPDYVYNPKEARIRKAMREATRDRSLGASPMLPRPRSRLPSHADWTQPQDDQLMMGPMDGMRRIDPPICGYPLSNSENNQYLSMNGYNKMENPSMMPNYMQLSPLAQLQQQTEMWHPCQENMRTRSLGAPFPHSMMPEMQSPPQYQSQEPVQETPTNLIMEKPRQSPGCASQPLSNAISSHLLPEENIHSMPNSNSTITIGGQTVTGDHLTESRQVPKTAHPLFPTDKIHQTITDNNLEADTQYIPLSEPVISCNKFEHQPKPKVETVTVAKKGQNVSSPFQTKCNHSGFDNTSFKQLSASPEFFSDSFRTDYINKYFSELRNYSLLSLNTGDGCSFSYASLSTNGNEAGNAFLDISGLNSDPLMIPTDIGYIPALAEDLCSDSFDPFFCRLDSKK